MDLDFDLELAERQPDRVRVAVFLGPGSEGPVTLRGVEMVLLCPDGEPLSHRMLLPIAGTITDRMVSTVELRGNGPLPPGTRILATAWSEEQQWEVRIPADPGTQMEAHCRGQICLWPEDDRDFESCFAPLTEDEIRRLAVYFPWLEPCPAEVRILDEEETMTESESLRKCCEELGLDEEATSWLMEEFDP